MALRVSRHLWEGSCPTCSVQTESETWLLDPAQQTRADIPSRAVSPEVVSRVCRVTRAPRLAGKVWAPALALACSLFGINQSGSASGRCRRLRSTSQLPRTSGVRSFTAGEADDGPDAASFWSRNDAAPHATRLPLAQLMSGGALRGRLVFKHEVAFAIATINFTLKRLSAATVGARARSVPATKERPSDQQKCWPGGLRHSQALAHSNLD